MKYLFVILFIICHYDTAKLFNKLNLVQVNFSKFAYKKLMLTKDNMLSVSPLTILDIPLLRNYFCYKNIRTNLWSLGIPIIFWNEEYMTKIRKEIENKNALKNYTSGKFNILPPADIIAYRLNWRRLYIDGIDIGNISLDSSWQDAQLDYVLPMRHSFVMEFNGGAESKQLCSDVKTKIINETLQSFELSVDFQRTINKKKKVPDINIQIKDIRSVKLYNESNCKGKPEDKCFVSKEFAEKWAYEISSQMMEKADMIHLNLQKDIFDAVFNYLCKETMSIFDIELKTIARLTKDINEMVCKVPNYVYFIKLKPCTPQYSRYGHLIRACHPEYIDYKNEIISRINPYQTYDEKNQFSLPVIHS